MARYRKVSVQIWGDRKFRRLSTEGALVCFHILTHPNMTSIGAMRGTVVGLASEIPETISPEGYAKGFEEGLREGLWEASSEAPLIVVPNFLRHNKPESPNVVRSWAAIVDTLPECELRDIHFQRVKAFAEGLGKGFREALPEAFREPLPKGMPNPEPEPEQEPEQEHKQERLPAPPNAPAAPPAEKRACASGLKSRFEQFWAEYPSKKARLKAWEAFEKLAPDDALLATMLEALSLQRTCNQWRRGVIPNPDTWLRERRWEDQSADPPTAPAAGLEGKPAPPPDPPPGWQRPRVRLPGGSGPAEPSAVGGVGLLAKPPTVVTCGTCGWTGLRCQATERGECPECGAAERIARAGLKPPWNATKRGRCARAWSVGRGALRRLEEAGVRMLETIRERGRKHDREGKKTAS